MPTRKGYIVDQSITHPSLTGVTIANAFVRIENIRWYQNADGSMKGKIDLSFWEDEAAYDADKPILGFMKALVPCANGDMSVSVMDDTSSNLSLNVRLHDGFEDDIQTAISDVLEGTYTISPVNI